jgi:hypothetical protein
MFIEKKLMVPAGTLAIVHHDMFHRATRHTDDCRWRPMIKMGAVRLVEPPPRDSDPRNCSWGARNRILLGPRQHPRST